jgi:sugar/nucleoside kinase (ribokinase family)
VFDATALGEILIDFTPAGRSENGFPLFEANPGGAPANVMVALQRLGKKTAFIGCVGKDEFGRQLANTLTAEGVDTTGLVFSDVHTTVAFVHLAENGERSFSFCRNPGADMMLRKQDVPLEIISSSRIFYFGSLSMTAGPSREAAAAALRHAWNQGIVICYDPNLRPPLWHSQDEAKRRILDGMAYAGIVKVSEEELAFLTGSADLSEGAKLLSREYKIPLLFVTAGKEGSYAFCGDHSAYMPGLKVPAIDTTGCGDAFFAGVLFCVLQNDLQYTGLTEAELEDMLKFGNTMGALAATRKGGLPAMPYLPQT